MVIISLFRLIYQSFFDPSHLWKATELNKKKTTLLFFLLALIVGLPFFMMGFRGFQPLAEDAEKVEQRLPAFTIQDGAIHFEEELDHAIVVRTNSMNLIIDINDQYRDRLEQRDLENARISLVFKEDHFIIYTAQVPIQISYRNASGLTDQFFRMLLIRFSNVNIIMIISLIIGSFITGIIEAGVRYLLFTIAANVVALFMKLRLPFSFNWKMMMVASAIPSLVFSLLNSFLIFPNGQLFLLLIISLYLYRKGIISYFKNLN